MNIPFKHRAALLFAAALAFPFSESQAAGAPQITQQLIPAGKFGRRVYRPLKPTFITIHATDNYSRGANARAHALNLQGGNSKGPHNAIGYVTWHYTVDDHSIYQSLPANERGEHADYDGPGNQSSIGIEMCVNRGGNFAQTLDGTARLTAALMRAYRIPITQVVPHMHWRQVRHDDRKDLGYKKCPGPLLDNGQLGPKWAAFLAKVQSYR